MGTTATAPAPQHMRALAQANRVRLARAELKRQVAEGEASVAGVGLDRPWEGGGKGMADLLVGPRALPPVPRVDPDGRDQDHRVDDRSSAQRARSSAEWGH